MENFHQSPKYNDKHCTDVRFASLLYGGFITAIVINPPESKLAKRTSVRCTAGTQHRKKMNHASCSDRELLYALGS